MGLFNCVDFFLDVEQTGKGQQLPEIRWEIVLIRNTSCSDCSTDKIHRGRQTNSERRALPLAALSRVTSNSAPEQIPVTRPWGAALQRERGQGPLSAREKAPQRSCRVATPRKLSWAASWGRVSPPAVWQQPGGVCSPSTHGTEREKGPCYGRVTRLLECGL